MSKFDTDGPHITFDEALKTLRNGVLGALAEADRDDCCLNLRGLSSRTGLPRETLRGLVADLRADGLASYQRGLWSYDGLPGGSGYGITPAGLAAVDEHAAREARQNAGKGN